MAGIFKAYDIRGIYDKELDPLMAEKIGRALVTFLKCRRVVVGMDMRTHSRPLFDGLAKGITEQGADVINLGLCSTPMCYHACGKLAADAGVMITASHNTGEWNGFKLCREQAIPISGATGIADLERIVEQRSFDPPSSEKGEISEYAIADAYGDFVRQAAALETPLRVVADYANGMGVIEARALTGIMTIDPLYDTLDGSFPHHEANPLKTENLRDLQAKVRDGEFAFGMAFDGDADRVGFVDETGAIVAMDMITALIARGILKENPGGVVLYDLRSSWAVRERIREWGGDPRMSRVGHAFIKQQMRDEKAVFAGELSGHYYFRENYCTESAALAAVHVANLVAAAGKPLSQIVAPLRRYVASGEINSQVEDTGAVFERLRERYAAQGRVIELDGLSVEFDSWWFNVRASNTEPLIRLNLEARTREDMEQKRDDVLALIRGTR